MANWNLPTVNSGYINFVTEMNDKIADAGRLNFGNPINLPENAIRYNRSLNNFQEYLGGSWFDKILSVYGGGTGGVNPEGARINLGLGSMAVQNSNAVNITGGSITGISFDISSVTSGVLPLARGGTGSSLALAGYGAVLLSSGSAVVFDNGTAIQNLNASNLSMGTVPTPRLPSTIAYTNVYNHFSFRQKINNSGGDWPRITFLDVSGAADSKIWEFNIIAGGGLSVWALNDTESAVMTSFAFHRNGVFSASALQGVINAGYLSGLVFPSNLGSGAANSSTFLRGDQVWAVPPTGSGSGGTFVPSGMIALFDTNCPAGWTRYSALDNRFPLGSSGAGGVGGSNVHSHQFDVTSGTDGNHDHSFGGSFGGSGSGSTNFAGTTDPTGSANTADAGGSFQVNAPGHTHNFRGDISMNVNVTTNIDGRTGGGGSHAHRVAGGTNAADHIPPYFTMVFCRKD